MRYAALDRHLPIIANPVTGTTHGLDQLTLEATVDLGPKSADVAFDEIRAGIKVE